MIEDPDITTNMRIPVWPEQKTVTHTNAYKPETRIQKALLFALYTLTAAATSCTVAATVYIAKFLGWI